MKIGLLGASFDTGNRGVSALAEASITCVLHQWPDAEVELLASGRTPKTYRLQVNGRQIDLQNLPVRFCRNVFMRNHYLVLLMTALLLKILPIASFRAFCVRRNPYLRRILELDLVADITGGDSFSDIYGTRRFIQGALLKYLWMLFGLKFYFLPQTYGPFKRRWVRWTARFLLKRADRIYSRDQQGYAVIQRLFNDNAAIMQNVKVLPDVAFVLEPQPVQDALTEALETFRREKRTIIGLNINGLLFNGGYNRKNMFSLAVDYPKMIREIIVQLLDISDTVILLTPHVIPPSSVYAVESDIAACRQVIEEIGHRDRIMVPDVEYDHKTIKYIIGYSDFFMGSRMHSCIAAMSQCIPTIGLAYSDKFQGVFDSVQQGENVLDLRTEEQKKINAIIVEKYTQKYEIESRLKQQIPSAQMKVTRLFSDAGSRQAL